MYKKNDVFDKIVWLIMKPPRLDLYIKCIKIAVVYMYKSIWFIIKLPRLDLIMKCVETDGVL